MPAAPSAHAPSERAANHNIKEKTRSLLRNIGYKRLTAIAALQLITLGILVFAPLTRFDRAVRFTLKWEGEFSCLEHDRGGITKYGITAPFLQDYRYAIDSENGEPHHVADVTKSQAVAMYRALWQKEKLDSIENESIARAIFDYTVHSSAREVIKRLQHLLNTQFGQQLPEDGKMGAKTLSAINQQDSKAFFKALQTERRTYLQTFIAQNPEQKDFENGWMQRIDAIHYKP